MNNIFDKFLKISLTYGLIILLALQIIVFGSANENFLSTINLFIVLQAVAVVSILALGVTATLVVDGFDLSIGATASSSMMLSAYVMVVWEMSGLSAIAICLLFGLIVGITNGLLIVKMKIPDLLATLGIMFLLAGLQRIPTGGRSIAVGTILPDGTTAQGKFTDFFLSIARGKVFEVIPNSVIIMIFLAICIWIFMEFTKWGRVMYAVGGNEQAAKLAGANVNNFKITAYAISGVYASIGGIIMSSRVGRGDIGSGGSLLLDSVAAALIGFAFLGLGRANPFGTAVGAIFIGLLLNGLTLLNTPYYTQDFIKGVVLVMALIITFGLKNKK
jgi:simple sugar transport system permease protein